MATKQIQGKYSTYIFVPKSSYTLTGSDRAASFGVSGPIELALTKCVSAPNGNNVVVFDVEGKIHINRMRVRMNGAPGIQAGVNHVGATLRLDFGATDADDVFYNYDSAFIQLTNFDEWIDTDLIVNPSKRVDGNSQYSHVSIAVNPDDTIFYVDDFNLQPDYVGQGITPIIEMEIDCSAGLVVRSNGVIF